MAASPRFRTKQATDVWSTKERLCLASSVLRSGDQNWVSVSRAIKPFGEASRPPDWFSQKNCALQYAELLEKVDAPKRKRGERSDGTDTPGDLIVRKLTMDRIEELKKVVYEEQQRHKKLKRELEMVRSGQLDEKLEDLLRGVQDEIRAKEIADNEHQKWLQEREQKVAALKVATSKGLYPLPIKNKRSSNSYNLTRAEELRRSSYQSEMSEPENNVESPLSEPLSIEVDETPNSTVSHLSTGSLVPDSSISQQMIKTSPRPPGLTITSSSTSPLLTSLLKSPSPATTPTTVTTIQTSQKAPILGSALQGTSPSKQSEAGSPSASGVPQRTSQGVPLPFFNPSSALATAAARQLAVATAASNLSTANAITASGFTVFSGDIVSSTTSNILGGIPISRALSQTHGILQSGQSATSSAPTLSRLLEMPPSMPGKLPPLPVVHVPTVLPPEIPSSRIIETPSIPVAETARIPDVPSSESDTSNFIGLVEGVCEVEEAFREELDPDGTGLDHVVVMEGMEDIVAELMKEEMVTPNDSPEGQPDMSEIHSLQPTDILEVDDEGSIEVVSRDLPIVETQVSAVVNEAQSGVSEPVVEAPLPETVEPTPEVIAGETIIEPEKEVSPQEICEEISEVAIQSDEVNAEVKTASPEVLSEIEETVDEETKVPVSNVEIAEAEAAASPIENETTYNLGEIVTEEVVISDKDVIEASEEEIDAKQQRGKQLKLPDDASDSGLPVIDNDDASETKADQSDESSEIIPLTPATASSSRETSEPREDECKSEIQDPSLQTLEDEEESLNLDSVKQKAPSSVSDSIPNSPASTPQSDDQENLREYKVWKKAIMLVYRAVANHKYANVFLHPVTNDVAPGYLSIVNRPKDLTAIKKNIETGVIRTTLEFQRDVMLMFQNAIMYNSSDHDVYHMALEMQKEVMEVIQLMVQTPDAKLLRGREPRDKKADGIKIEAEFKDEEEVKRKRTSTSESSDSRPKKRRRQED